MRTLAITMADQIDAGVRVHGVHEGTYCYEVDGFGNCNRMDDANMPSLLGLPLLDPTNRVVDPKNIQANLRVAAF
jgi:uncharacterized protein